MQAEKKSAVKGVVLTAHKAKCSSTEQNKNKGFRKNSQGNEFPERSPRVLKQVEAIPFRWPSKALVASEYIAAWLEEAGAALRRYRLSQATMKCIGGHTSRKDGSCRLTDAGISSRTARSIRSVKRDLQRLRALGFIITQNALLDGEKHIQRIIRLSVPIEGMRGPTLTPELPDDPRANVSASVGPTDKGDHRNV